MAQPFINPPEPYVNQPVQLAPTDRIRVLTALSILSLTLNVILLLGVGYLVYIVIAFQDAMAQLGEALGGL